MIMIQTKDKIFIGIVIILLLIIFFKPSKNIIDTSKFDTIQKSIDKKLDSINNKEYQINVEKINVSKLENGISSIQKNIDNINEKLIKDTGSVNTYSDSTINTYFSTRYHY